MRMRITWAAAALVAGLFSSRSADAQYATFPRWVELLTPNSLPLIANGFGNQYTANPLWPTTAYISDLFQFYTNGQFYDGDGNCVTHSPSSNQVIADWCVGEGSYGTWNYEGDAEFHNNAGCLSITGCYVDSNGNWHGDCQSTVQTCESRGVLQQFFVRDPSQVQPPNYTIAPYAPALPYDGFSSTPMVMDIQYDSRNNGTPVDLATYNATPAQYWWYEPSTRKIHVSDSGNPPMCLDVPYQSSGVYNNGLKVQIWQCLDNDPNQEWFTVYPNQLVNAASSKCLDAPANTFGEGTLLEIWSCWGGLNQQWGGSVAGLPGTP